MSDNPPAFPYPHTFTGMSLRDWFAGQALAGVMTAASGLGTIAPKERAAHLEQVAGILYEVADAMLGERERQP